MPPRRERSKGQFSWQAVAVAALTFTFAYWAWQWLVSGRRDAGPALIVIPLLTLLSLPLFIRAAAVERRFDLAGLMATGLALRFFAAYYRHIHAADALNYEFYGNQTARSFRQFDFSADPGAAVPGTGGMRVLAGLVAVVASDYTAKFLVFTWLGFLGCYILYRAFVTALPNADHHRYALLIFLWPTLIFWPSSMGKDSWMLFTLGIASLGVAHVLVRRPGGYVLLVIGSMLGSFVRPHISLMALLAFGIALLVSRRETTRPGITPSAVAKVAGLVVLVVLGGLVASRAASVLGVDDFSGSSIDSALNQNIERTQQGGSAFRAADPGNPVGYVESTVTILFRPFPNEAHEAEQIATSAEGLLLIGLVIASWRRLISVPRRLRNEGYVTYAVVYLLIFFFAFGTISNFGILARQRSQAMPFVFVLLALPPLVTKAKRTIAPARATPAP